VRTYGDSGVLRYHGDPVIGDPPVITLHPASRTVGEGGAATFRVEVTGTEPVGYAWRFNGSNLEGATNSVLSLTNVSLSNEGTYSMVASNDFGWTASANAFLNVNRTPRANAGATRLMAISVNNSNATVVLDGTFSFDPDADPLTYSWFSNGSAVAIATRPVSAVTLPVGVQTLDLQVSDGFVEHTTSITIEVITWAEALRRLRGEVRASDLRRGVRYLFRVPLVRAQRFFEHNRRRLGVVRLERFQRRVHRLVAPREPELAARWNGQIQLVIDAFTSPDALLPANMSPAIKGEL
jgi:hypothetical protein